MPNDERIQPASPQTTTQTSPGASKIAERLGAVSEHATQLVQDVQDKSSALLHRASDKVASTYREAQAETSELLHGLDERARDAGEKTVRYARRVGTSTTTFVRANALPLAVVGAGLGWLIWNIVEDGRRQRALASPLSTNPGNALSRGQLTGARRTSRAVPPPPPAAATTSGAKLIGVRVSDAGYQG